MGIVGLGQGRMAGAVASGLRAVNIYVIGLWMERKQTQQWVLEDRSMDKPIMLSSYNKKKNTEKKLSYWFTKENPWIS